MTREKTNNLKMTDQHNHLVANLNPSPHKKSTFGELTKLSTTLFGIHKI